MKRYVPPAGDDERLLGRRVAELVKSVSHSGRPRYTGFLNEREGEVALAALRRTGWDRSRFEGGYEGAERKMLCVFADEDMVAFPFTSLEIAPQGQGAERLTHRDYLGALLALGLERGCVGDIVVGEDGALAYVQASMVPLLEEELTGVGRVPVQVRPGSRQPQNAGSAETLRVNVASLRLDAVLAAVLNLPRTAAAALVEGGSVQVNHVEAAKSHLPLEEGDVLSVRGRGKFKLERLGGTSRKNRRFIEVLQY